MENVALVVFLLLGGLVALYVQVRTYPTKPCRRCNGSGERRDRSGKSIGECPRCHNRPGKVKRPRMIAKLLGVAK